MRRNLDRGVSAKDLNISFLKRRELDVMRSVETVANVIQKNWEGTVDEMNKTLEYWDGKSQEFIHGFLHIFDRPLVSNMKIK